MSVANSRPTVQRKITDKDYKEQRFAHWSLWDAMCDELLSRVFFINPDSLFSITKVLNSAALLVEAATRAEKEQLEEQKLRLRQKAKRRNWHETEIEML